MAGGLACACQRGALLNMAGGVACALPMTRVCPRTVRMLGNHVGQVFVRLQQAEDDGLWPMVRRKAVSSATRAL
eukprot:1883361-Prymnesium_polylepis.1